MYLQDTTSETVVSKCKSVFARWCFKSFSKDYGFQHITSNPHYPLGNGEAEQAVQEAKKILRQEDPFLALMIHQNTKNTATGFSPAELMTVHPDDLAYDQASADAKIARI